MAKRAPQQRKGPGAANPGHFAVAPVPDQPRPPDGGLSLKPSSDAMMLSQDEKVVGAADTMRRHVLKEAARVIEDMVQDSDSTGLEVVAKPVCVQNRPGWEVRYYDDFDYHAGVPLNTERLCVITAPAPGEKTPHQPDERNDCGGLPLDTVRDLEVLGRLLQDAETRAAASDPSTLLDRETASNLGGYCMECCSWADGRTWISPEYSTVLCGECKQRAWNLTGGN